MKKQQSLLGLPVVEVDDMEEHDIRLVPPVEVYPLRVTPIPGSPGDALRFKMEIDERPGGQMKKKIAAWLGHHLPFDWMPNWANNRLARFSWRYDA